MKFGDSIFLSSTNQKIEEIVQPSQRKIVYGTDRRCSLEFQEGSVTEDTEVSLTV